MKKTLILLALALSTTACVSFVSDDVTYEPGSVVVTVKFPDGKPAEGPLAGRSLVEIGNGVTNGGGSRSENDVAAQIRAAITAKGSATAEGASSDARTDGDGE